MRERHRGVSSLCLRFGVVVIACVTNAVGEQGTARGADAKSAMVASGSPDGKPPAAQAGQPPVMQATPWPGYVIQGGAIPQGWQPQAVPYQVMGADGRPTTVYYAPTYTFTYPIGPPVPMLSPVNRRQAYPGPAGGNGWNYRTQGAAPPAYALPPPTVARYQPQPYQFPQNAPQLSGQPLVPPSRPLPQPPPAASWQAPPPTTWVSSAQATPPAPAPAPAPAAAAQPTAPAGSTGTRMWRVVGVHDGDTLTCLDGNNQQQQVRLAEIDAPELGQDFGKVSREALASMVFGKTVEVADEGKDRYGRWLAHVLVNGTDVNREMVATGNAWHYAAYSRDQSLAQVQSDARARQIGLWAQPDPVAPWEFRATEMKR